MESGLARRPALRRVAAAVVAVATASGTRAALAQGNPYGAPIGGRSALMGNTGVALGIDGAAPFLNPATIVRLDDHRFAFSVNFFNFTLSQLSGFHQPGPVDAAQFGNVALSGTGLTSSAFNVLPSTLCLFFTLADGSPDPNAAVTNLSSWRQKLAICLGTTESQSVGFSALPFSGTTSIGPTIQSQSLVATWSRLNLGPSYSVAVSRRLAFGISLHGVLSSESYILDSSAITAAATNGAVQSSLGIAGGASSFDISAIVGAIYSAAPYTFGLSFTAPAIHALGGYTGTMHDAYGSGATANATIANATGSFTAGPPIRVALGAGVEWPRLSLELNESLYIPSPSGFAAAVTGTTTTLAGTALMTVPLAATYSVPEHPVLNTAAGAEYFVKKDFSLVGGASFNLSALPPLAATLSPGNLIQERQNTVTASAGVGTYGRGGTLLLGFQLGYGWGESLAPNPYVTPNDLSVIDTHTYSVMLILAGSTSLKNLGHAVVRIQNVISGDEPTKETPPNKEPPPRSAPATKPASPPSTPAHAPVSAPPTPPTFPTTPATTPVPAPAH